MEHQSYDYRNRDFSDLAETAFSAAGQGEIVLCIMNTVDAAQELYDRVRSTSSAALPLERIGLLHSRFPVWERQELEEYWLNAIGKRGDRSLGAVLVATQVVEQSVDIDADRIITELAPTDMLLQRLGRLWRHERTDRSPAAECRVTILHPQFQDESDFADCLATNGCVYSPYVLWRSHQEWKNRDFIRLPTDIREILEATYAEDETESETISELHEQMEQRRKEMRKLATACGNRKDFPEMKDRESKTRYSDSPSLEILLLRSEPRPVGRSCTDIILSDGAECRLIPQVKLVRNALDLQRNIVSVRMRRKDRELVEELPDALSPYFFRDEQVVPLVMTEDESGGFGYQLCTLGGVYSGFRYQPGRGVFRKEAS
ncbi:MAG: CRISPR-associated helicase Cas3', partial [Planctomycetia bacterium]|nr:CRISPR-associated helicase Cas3' [Planctomycetia bacterium]